MQKNIVRDQNFLSQKSVPATRADLPTALDLVDTLAANADRAVGLAANMIGVKKQIIAVSIGVMNIAMLNPKLTKKSHPYQTKEGCLSLTGERSTTRYKEIEVQYQDLNFKKQTQHFSGWIAEIIQHEIDHCAGILI
ncbi:peptide deformylase [Pediococcus acidilactici]|jgi:peptide deformylase|uniref:peptide deformylase n=1 Tax=Pediococcus acidilactici TaxID=1254 RepID=UPI0004650815|nr:peptide deformylase [Pediococcus acidilactici]KAF0494601.1 peptide deformylase [Pediococcus acidilactici]MCF4060673.1 peptide deformylase [Pediococcus acidilactici]MCI1276008.1 peptide deformylase [Pediococcus acidilactici]MCJ2191384.1 peptide deformylase [Pediococcus acidilactici]MWB54016.1 peptide deformylase [Pediococcus acidilactici]